MPNAPNFTFDNRLVDQGEAWLTSIRSNLTWIRGSHSLKGGMYFEQSRNSEGNGGVGAGPWAGQFTFQTDTSNPVDTNHSYANALLGTFRDYTEIDAFSEVIGKRNIGEFYLQDTWKATRRLTVDYGVRFLWYTPWYSTQPAAVFVPERYDPAKVPRLYQPAVVNDVNVAFDPVTGETLGQRLRRHLRARHGRSLQRHGDQQRPQLPEGLPRQPGDRAGAAASDSPGTLPTTARRRCTRARGLYHNPHVNANGLDAMARNPPAQNTPSIIYGTMDTLLAVGAAGAFSNRPSAVFGIERDAQTPKSYNYSVGVQRELGWGTVVDVTYAGFQMRNAEMNVNINPVPDGARFVDVNPQNRNPQTTNAAKPDEFLRPYLGYQDITIRSHFGTGSLQLPAGAAQPPLHPRPAVGRRLHAREDSQRRHELQHAAAGDRRGTRVPPARPSGTTSSSTTRGTCRTGAVSGTTC